MPDRARFDLVMIDSVSPSARAIVGSLGEVQRSLRGVGAAARGVNLGRIGGLGRVGGRGAGRGVGAGIVEGMDRATRATRRTSSSTDRMVTSLGRLGWAAGGLATIAGMATRAAGAFAGMAHTVGGAYLEIARFREDSLATLRSVSGSSVVAGRVFNNALVMAEQTPLDPQDVVGTFSQLFVGGFSERELAPLAAAAADLQAARGRTASDSLVRVLTQIRGLGRVQRGDITMQALSAGLNAGDIFESIARQMNLGTGRTGIRAAEQAVAHGRVNDRVAIEAFMDSARRRYNGGGALGTFSRGASNTLTGALSNARGAMFSLLGSIDLSKSPGVQAFTNAVLTITGALGRSSVSGQRLRTVITAAADRIGSVFGGVTTARAEGWINTLSDAIPIVSELVQGVIAFGQGFGGGMLDTIGPALRAFGMIDDNGAGTVDTMRELGQAIGMVTGAIVVLGGVAALAFSGIFDIVTYLHSIPGEAAWLVGEVETMGLDAGRAIIDGFVGGLRSGAERVAGAVRETFSGAVDTARGVLDWHSPSGVFEEAGLAVAEGFQIGVAGGAPTARAAVAQLVAPQGNASAASGRVGPVAVTFNIDGAGRDARAIVDDVMERLTDYFEGMALQGATDGG